MIDLFGYSVEIDTRLTKDWYVQSKGWNCDCGHCRNFMKIVEEDNLPEEVTRILSELDIPGEKPTYVCEIYHDDKGLLYQFSYRAAGSILTEKNKGTSLEWGEIRCCHEPYPYGAPDFPSPHFDLEFWVTLPWILEEPLT
jgi:hypothetical protein